MNSSQVLGTPPSMCILSIFTLHVRTCIYTCSMCVHCVCVYMYVSVLCLSICVDVCRHVCIVYIHVYTRVGLQPEWQEGTGRNSAGMGMANTEALGQGQARGWLPGT